MEFAKVEEILSFATDMEKEAVEFYTRLAKEATRASLKETFENFVGEEQKHVALLEDMTENKEKIDSYEFREIQDLKISDYMVPIDYEEGMPMPEILKIAMKREEKAVKLYTELSEKTDHEQVKKVMLILVQEEAKHKLILESMYDDYLGGQDN